MFYAPNNAAALPSHSYAAYSLLQRQQLQQHNKQQNCAQITRYRGATPESLRVHCYSTTDRTTTTTTSSTTTDKVKDTARTKSTLDEFRAREEAELHRDDEEEQTRQQSEQSADEEKRNKANEIRNQILEAALQHVSEQGWTRNAIVCGAHDAGFPSVVHGMFPEGGFALVAYFNGKCNGELVEHLDSITNGGKIEITNPSEFLVNAVKMRLEMLAPYKTQWPQALALIALPQNAATALAQLLTLVDDICYYSGDRSVDIGWYTRRIGLATIYKMTELYMLQDTSPQHSSTWEFLGNRMEEAIQLQTVLMQTGEISNRFQRSFNSAFLTARNILGMGYNRD